MEGSENGFAPLQTWFPQSCLLLLGDQGKFQSCSLSFFMQTGRELEKLEREDIVSLEKAARPHLSKGVGLLPGERKAGRKKASAGSLREERNVPLSSEWYHPSHGCESVTIRKMFVSGLNHRPLSWHHLPLCF